ncbi:HNH endonuclease signature motif containing protein [Kineococcus rubinsiae]|uniref:HNH endonuclease signature motif containing protein n=1 Tax=Kineococcus rubinsiae TaxID=2609562 RepID=UPI001431EC08|nr:HNH endonuclease signature motif containing protein [Kineococcus rubinsiae]
MFEPAALPAPDILPGARDAALVDLLITLDRERCRLDALGLRAVEELRQRRVAEHPGLAAADETDLVQLTGEQVLASELCAALRIADATAAQRISTARTLTEELPATLEAYAAGDLHIGHVKAVLATSELLAERVVDGDGNDQDPLYADDALRRARAELEKTCLTGPEDLSVRQLRRRLRRTLARLSSRHTLRTRVTREAGQFVRIDVCDDGLTAHLSGPLPLTEALRLDAFLTGCADATNPENPRGIDGEGRSHAARRVDALLDLKAGSGTSPSMHVNVTVAATTLLGLDDEPSEVVTPTLALSVPAEVARDLAACGTWRRILTDPAGNVVDVGPRTYKPSAATARRVRARDSTCIFPGCTRPAQNCDLDHVMPHARGGPTTVENLAPECRHHHRLKTHTRWQVEPLPTRGWRWTSPTGHTYDTNTDPPPY